MDEVEYNSSFTDPLFLAAWIGAKQLRSPGAGFPGQVYQLPVANNGLASLALNASEHLQKNAIFNTFTWEKSLPRKVKVGLKVAMASQPFSQ